LVDAYLAWKSTAGAAPSSPESETYADNDPQLPQHASWKITVLDFDRECKTSMVVRKFIVMQNSGHGHFHTYQMQDTQMKLSLAMDSLVPLPKNQR
jgi:hypothetical protein